MTMTKGVGAKIKMLTQTDRFCVRRYFLSRVETKVIAFIIHSFLIYLLFFQVHTHTHILRIGSREMKKKIRQPMSDALFFYLIQSKQIIIMMMNKFPICIMRAFFGKCLTLMN